MPSCGFAAAPVCCYPKPTIQGTFGPAGKAHSEEPPELKVCEPETHEDSRTVLETHEDSRTVLTLAGVRMPRFIYGTAWKKEATTECVVAAVQAGFRGIDTACQPRHYREDLVGEALARLRKEGYRRRDVFLQTKFTPMSSQDPGTTPYDRSSPVREQVVESFQVSLRNLRVKWVDCLVLHSPCETFWETMEAWQAMEELVQSRKVRQLGISNIDLEMLQDIYHSAHVKPVVVQNRFYAKSMYDAKLRHWSAAYGIRYQSFWSLTANLQVLSSPQLKAIAETRGMTPEQVFFRFLLDEGICPLTGTRSGQHMAEDIQVLKELSLSHRDGSVIVGLLYPSAAACSECCIL